MRKKTIWKVRIREAMKIQHEVRNDQDKKEVAVVRDGEDIGNIPWALASKGTRIICQFLKKT